MRKNRLKEIWAAGQCAVTGWLSIPAGYSAEGIASQGFDAVTVDLQHGMIDVQAAIAMLQAISITPAVPLARVGSNDGAAIMKLLDAGAYGIICPMISTRADAEKFAEACRYPPLGQRSYGPARGLLYGGPDYFTHADKEIVTIAMIETVEGVDNIDAILAVEQIDAVYIGPNDLSLAFGEAPAAEPGNTRGAAAIDHILARAHARGKKAGIFCSSGLAANKRRLDGFDLVTPGNDLNILVRAARRELEAARGGGDAAGAVAGSY